MMMRRKIQRFGHTAKQSICSTGHRLRNGSVSAHCPVGSSYWAAAGTVKKPNMRGGKKYEIS
jgi:hypothetical protein